MKWFLSVVLIITISVAVSGDEGKVPINCICTNDVNRLLNYIEKINVLHAAFGANDELYKNLKTCKDRYRNSTKNDNETTHSLARALDALKNTYYIQCSMTQSIYNTTLNNMELEQIFKSCGLSANETKSVQQLSNNNNEDSIRKSLQKCVINEINKIQKLQDIPDIMCSFGSNNEKKSSTVVNCEIDFTINEPISTNGSTTITTANNNNGSTTEKLLKSTESTEKPISVTPISDMKNQSSNNEEIEEKEKNGYKSGSAKTRYSILVVTSFLIFRHFI